MGTEVRPVEDDIASRAACEALLELLRKHHGNDMPEREEPLEVIPPVKEPLQASVPAIKRVVAGHFGISIADMDSPVRKAKLVIPRQIAVYLARNLTTRSFLDLGQRFGGRDHSTILHAVKKIQAKIDREPAFKLVVDGLAGHFQ